ncbi:MAG: hypothetical protein LBE55_03920 [Clostridiales bacterium]|jgi:hypothetical protein|nr:hypothetical protein [Clostridiales bacterium]
MDFTVIAALLFIAIPPIWWKITTKENTWFLPWVGLKAVEKKSTRDFWLSIGLAAFFILISFPVIDLIFPDLFQMDFSYAASLGMVILIVALGSPRIVILFLLGEIFFRGFLGKRLIGKLGFAKGNTIQALIYGLFLGTGWESGGEFMMVANIAMFAGFGWIAGYITEKQAGGSIIPVCVLNPVAIIASVSLVYVFGLLFWTEGLR